MRLIITELRPVSLKNKKSIICSDVVVNEEVRRQIQAAYDELLTLIKKRKLQCFGFWFSKISTGHSERKKEELLCEQLQQPVLCYKPDC